LVYAHAKMQAAGPASRIALHLSNLQGLDFQRFPQAMGPSDGRSVYDALQRGKESCEALLRKFLGTSLMLWAPTDTALLVQLASAFQSFVLSSQSDMTLHLVVPHDPFPGCDKPESILDLWWHGLLADKWRSSLKQVEFLRQPTRCVFSGSIGPLHHMKNLAVFTLSTDAMSMPMSVVQWRPTLLTHMEGPALVVDCDEREELLTHRSLVATALPGLISWEGPRRSLGSRGVDRRCVFIGTFEASRVSDLDLRLYSKALQGIEGLQGVLIGSRSLFSDRSSYLVDMGHPRAISEVVSLIDEVVLVSPRLAIMITAKSADTWSQRLTDQFKADPLVAIEKIRSRVSRNGGRPWAKPCLLQNHMRAAKSRMATSKSAGASAARVELRSCIAVQGLTMSRANSMITSLMQRVSEVLGLPLRHCADVAAMRPHDWAVARNPKGDWAGRILIESETPREVQDLFNRIHGSSIEVNGMSYALEVDNAYANLDAAAVRNILWQAGASSSQNE
jgi:hypothetical protein